MVPRGRATQQSRDFYLCISIYCDLRAVPYQLLVNFINVGPPRGFLGSGDNGYLLSGSCGALVIFFRDFGGRLIVLGI